MTRRNGIIATAVTATAAIAAAIIVTLAGGGGSASHVDTRMDASDNLVPPYDFRKSYARTGTINYTRDATRSREFVADVLPYTTDTTDTGWPVEITQNNRFPTNVSGACSSAPWDCSTATMTSDATDPTGGTTASAITMGGGSLDATAFGYTNSTALDLRLWAKCSTSTLTIAHEGSTGSWTVNCTTVGGDWALLIPAHAAVTEGVAFESDGSGFLRMRLSGTDAEIWHITATEKTSYHHSTIPTSDATGSTVGTASWPVDNSTGAFWAVSGVTKTETNVEYGGTDCWNYSAPTISLTGSAGCEGTWYGLTLVWSY